MRRRNLLRTLAALPLLPAGLLAPAHGGRAADATDAARAARAQRHARRRVRPADRDWPSQKEWDDFNRSVGGRLVRVRSPFAGCAAAPQAAACTELFAALRNPYFIGDEPALTQTLGWVDAWTSAPSVYAVAAAGVADVVAAVNFARRKNLRVVVKGGGHSYQGTSNAADSLLIWTRHMNSIAVLEAFVPAGCPSAVAEPAVAVEAGAIWMQVYDAVTTQNGRYVQGGGCTTVGVAGLIQGGGFGSFSKRYGSAAGSLMQAEVVTADGQVLLANACTNPDLFWSIKGGGGGSFGVVTRVWLKTHELPEVFGVVNATIQAASDDSFRKLIGNTLKFYRDNLFNAHWGEQIVLKANRVLTLQLESQGLSKTAAEDLWSGFFAEIANSPDEFSFVSKPTVFDFPARHAWDPEFLKRVPGIVRSDARAGAPAGNVYWAGDGGQCGQVIHGYDSLWLPAALLDEARLPAFAAALHAAAKQWQVSLHLNKGLAGAPPQAIAAARDSATNPAVAEAFALAILGAEEPPAYPGIAGHEPDLAAGRGAAAGIQRAMAELRAVVPAFASYVSESNYFATHWQSAFWGTNYPRLERIKQRYDPDGLFFVHHGVGSEAWSPDGFTRL